MRARGRVRERERKTERERERERERVSVCVLAGHLSVRFMCAWCPGGREDGWDPEQE